MTEYIDRAEAIKAVCRKCTACSVLTDKDDKAFSKAHCAVPHNRWTGCPRMNGTIMRPDDYCSHGERKEV